MELLDVQDIVKVIAQEHVIALVNLDVKVAQVDLLEVQMLVILVALVALLDVQESVEAAVLVVMVVEIVKALV